MTRPGVKGRDVLLLSIVLAMMKDRTHDNKGGLVGSQVFLKLIDVTFLMQPSDRAEGWVVCFSHSEAAI